MKPIFKYALRLFLIMTISMFILNTILAYLWDDEIKIIPFVIKSILFGVFMSIITTKMHEHGLHKAGISEFTDENLKPYAEHEIKTSITPEDIVGKLKTNAKYNDIRTKGNNIYCKSPMSMYSFGEKIEINTIKEDDQIYTYHIRSKSLFGLTLADYGKNKQNVNKVINIIYA